MKHAARKTHGPWEVADSVLGDALAPYPAAHDIVQVVMAIFGGAPGRAIDGPGTPRRNVDLECFYAVVANAQEIRTLVWVRGSSQIRQEQAGAYITETADTITALLQLPPHMDVPEPSSTLPRFIAAVARIQSALKDGSSYFLYWHPSISRTDAPSWMEYVLRECRSPDIALTRTQTWDKAKTAVDSPRAHQRETQKR